MDVDPTICRLFSSVLNQSVKQYNVNSADIRTGIQNMKEVYKPNPTSLTKNQLDVANYNDIAHRCAYLHKYAPFHTALVQHIFSRAMEQEATLKSFREFLNVSGRLEICSLGGGPGSDILGVIFVLLAKFGYIQLSATVIDVMINWEMTFKLIIETLRCDNYGCLSDFVQPQYFHWNYIGHNLLGKMTNNVNKSIQGAHLVTMVKFVSAAACKDTAQMIQKIFRSLKPGALVLYIDNAGGGFHQIMQKCARDCRMITVFGPLKHEHYMNSNFNVKKFGYTPCLETKVSVHMWKKSQLYQQSFDSDYISSAPSTVLTVPQRFPSRTVLPSSKPSQSSSRLNATVNQYNVVNANIFINSNNWPLPQNYFQNQGVCEASNNRALSQSKLQPQILSNSVSQQPIPTKYQSSYKASDQLAITKPIHSQPQYNSQQYDKITPHQSLSSKASKQQARVKSPTSSYQQLKKSSSNTSTPLPQTTPQRSNYQTTYKSDENNSSNCCMCCVIS